MPAKQYHKSYQQFKCNEAYIKASELSSQSFRNACLNNDMLLRRHGISFARQLREMECNDEIKIGRAYYEYLRNGTKLTGQLNWISYIVYYWRKYFDYNFSTAEFQLPELNINAMDYQIAG